MVDEKTKVGEPDRSRVSGSEDYEIRDFAEAAGISIEEARRAWSRTRQRSRKADGRVEREGNV
jgi:hypothetical protein